MERSAVTCSCNAHVGSKPSYSCTSPWFHIGLPLSPGGPSEPRRRVDTHGRADHNGKVQFSLAIIAAMALVLGWGTPATAQTTAAHPVKVHLTLAAQRVVAGHPITGTVVLTNPSARAILVDTCAIDGWLAV